MMVLRKIAGVREGREEGAEGREREAEGREWRA